MLICAIDPGSVSSGWVELSVDSVGKVKLMNFGNDTNKDIRDALKVSAITFDRIVMDFPVPSGMPVAAETFEMTAQCGRFEQVVEEQGRAITRWERTDTVRWSGWHPAPRRKCKTDKKIPWPSKDSVVIAACKRYFGDNAVGGIKCCNCGGKGWKGRDHIPCGMCLKTPGWEFIPGPLYGVTADAWQALGSGLAYIESTKEER